MSKKIKMKPTGREWGPENDTFDWSQYEDGFTGSNLKVNTKVKTKNGDKVYCHEPYAQELYDLMEAYFNGRSISAKDNLTGSLYSVDDIHAVSDHEIRIDSLNGSSTIIDMNKETQFIKSVGIDNVKGFMNCLNDDSFKKNLLSLELFAKQVDKNRTSIWEGYKAKVEFDLMQELKDGTPKHGFAAKITDMNNGGFTVEVLGVKCFLPISLAASGPVTEPETLLGKTVMVCVVNYSTQTNNFVVSHKKFLEITLPSKIASELYVGKEVSVKVTGISRNGLFCAIKDDLGEFVFTSLMHRTTMSPDAESSFDRKEYIVGDQFHAYIHKLLWADDGSCRIVIGDAAPKIENKEEAAAK